MPKANRWLISPYSVAVLASLLALLLRFLLAPLLSKLGGKLKDLLDYSRLSRADITLQPVNLDALVTRVLTQCRNSRETHPGDSRATASRRESRIERLSCKSSPIT